MSPLFKKSETKAAEAGAAQTECERLAALPPAGLAAELMGAFGPDGPKGKGLNGGINILQVMSWKLQSIPGGTKYLKQLNEPVREALQALEHAELVLRTTHGAGTWYSATRLGQDALAQNTVAQHLSG